MPIDSPQHTTDPTLWQQITGLAVVFAGAAGAWAAYLKAKVSRNGNGNKRITNQEAFERMAQDLKDLKNDFLQIQNFELPAVNNRMDQIARNQENDRQEAMRIMNRMAGDLEQLRQHFGQRGS